MTNKDIKPDDEREFALRRELRGLAGERNPSRDLWPGIQQRLGQQPTTRPVVSPRASGRRVGWRVWTAMAASVLLVSLMLRPWEGRLQLPAVPAEEHASTAAAGSDGSLVESRMLRIQEQAMTAEYHAALQQLDAGSMPASLQAAARELDDSAKAIRSAMARDPSAVFLMQRLQSVYEQRLRLGLGQRSGWV